MGVRLVNGQLIDDSNGLNQAYNWGNVNSVSNPLTGVYSRTTTPSLFGDTASINLDISGNNTLLSNLGKTDIWSKLSPEQQQYVANNFIGGQSGNYLQTVSQNQLNTDLNNFASRSFGADLKGNGASNSGGLFGGTGTDQFGNRTFMGGTGLQWAGFGANLGLGLWGAYQQHKQTKLAQQAFEEQKALQRANYKMQAKSFNNSLRNQQSGRGFVGMSGSAKRTLGREYDARKAEETY